MEVIIQPTVEQAVELAARLIAARVRAKPDLVLGLAAIAAALNLNLDAPSTKPDQVALTK
jgi:hypothetical protein